LNADALPPVAEAPTARALADAFAPGVQTSPKIVPRPDRKPLSAMRRAFVHNMHTGETLNAVYFEAGRYVPAALAAAMRVLRDWRNGEEHVMDPRLFDLLHTLGAKLDVSRPFQILSGYRSKQTNAMMHERSPQVAAKSQHVLGKALDICIEGVDLSRLHRAALSLRAGGVGFYPQSGFVHVDVGPVRQWFGT
jgi:uncharacterized protein YcbK (DUF882 family)